MATKRFKDLSDRARTDPERVARVARERTAAVGELVAHTLAELRQTRQVTQHELARAMATSQPNVSRIEHADEVELTTLRRYVEALGGHLEVTAVFDDDWLPLAVGDDQR
ncbi:MAG: helix-turn-helix domain-containing protein [Egibacteraceae bacterium]